MLIKDLNYGLSFISDFINLEEPRTFVYVSLCRSVCWLFCVINAIVHVYLRRQQERGLMQKARRLMNENSVSFQMFLILLYSITLGSESQISVFKQCQSIT